MKSLLISRKDRDPRGIICDVVFIFCISDLSISIRRNSPPLPDSSKTGPRQVTKGEDCVTNRSRDYANLLRHAAEREWRETKLKLSFRALPFPLSFGVWPSPNLRSMSKFVPSIVSAA